MEIRCKNCEHVGEAAEVRALPHGVGLVCAACSHVNALNLAGDKEASGSPGVAAPSSAAKVDKASAPEAPHEMVDWVGKHAVKYLIPAAGEGKRCPKCLTLLGEHGELEGAHCVRCGLKIADAERFAPGSAPWELAPAGKSEVVAEADRLWPAFVGKGNAARAEYEKKVDAWCVYVKEQELIDYGIRKLQLGLIRHPDEPKLLEALTVLAEKLQQRVLIATTEAQVSAETYRSEISQLRQRLLRYSLVFWGVIFILLGVVILGEMLK